jgi:hypothetical protein
MNYITSCFHLGPAEESLTNLESSPSSVDGINDLDEWNHRVFGCELIQEAGILLRL